MVGAVFEEWTCILENIKKVGNSLDTLEKQSSPRKLALEALDNNSRKMRGSKVDRH